jgi:hypothetical protein
VPWISGPDAALIRERTATVDVDRRELVPGIRSIQSMLPKSVLGRMQRVKLRVAPALIF